MSKAYKIQTSLFRYIVPFGYEGEFESAIENIDDTKCWERNTPSKQKGESDLYSHIRNEFRFEDNEQRLSAHKTGCEWVISKSPNISNMSFRYFTEKLSKESVSLPDGIDVYMEKAGLILFRNGLGFIWYEPSLPKNISTAVLMEFQNKVKELNRVEPTLWEIRKNAPEFAIVEKRDVPGKDEKQIRYLTPFFISNWLKELLDPLQVHFVAERKSAYSGMLKAFKKKTQGLENEVLLGQLPNNEQQVMVPDKAILFSYILMEYDAGYDLQEWQALSYHLTNGYKESYMFSPDIAKDIKRPFKNVLWYATQEGAAYLAWATPDNRTFFESTLIEKIKGDYFVLWIKVLYQSLSLLRYSENIQNDISGVNNEFLYAPSNRHITELLGEINLFLTKSMATSVSHIHHQSEFYIYIKEQLRIEQDVQSVTAGLDALGELQKEKYKREEDKKNQDAWEAEKERDREERKQDEKTQKILNLISILAVFSALVDAYDFIGKWGNVEGGWSSITTYSPLFWWEVGGMVFILASVAYVVIVPRLHFHKSKKH